MRKLRIKNNNTAGRSGGTEKIMKKTLTKFYRERLAENIINCIAEIKQISEREAMKIYYSSRLAKMIEIGKYGIDNLDYRNLAEDLIENEPELFAEK